MKWINEINYEMCLFSIHFIKIVQIVYILHAMLQDV